MNINKEDMLLYAVTDQAWTGKMSLYEQVEAALKGGVTIVQLREKNLHGEELVEEAKKVTELCHKYGVKLLIDDDVDVVLASGADGVHVGQNDMSPDKVREILGPDKIIGVTCKTVEQALKASQAGADYLGVGAMFETGTKKDTYVIAHDTLDAICDAIDIPVVAIGGISKKNLNQLQGRKMSGVALVSAIFAQPDIEMAARELKEMIKNIVEDKKMKTALTIAGSDCSGGAGIQADIKTMTANGVYAMSAITALTAQNTTGVTGIMEVTPEFLEAQLDAIFTDIYPDAIKTGMVSSSDLIRVIAAKIKEYDAKNIVIDPVMVATSGSKLISDEAIDTLKAEMLPLATVITPNIPEAEVLSDMTIQSEEEMVAAAKLIYEKYGCAVLCKGGHQINDANDLLYSENGAKWFYGKRINNPNTHGTGCTLSSAIASNLAKGEDLETAVLYAKNYISGALNAMLDLGKGSGPMNHAFAVAGEYKKF